MIGSCAYVVFRLRDGGWAASVRGAQGLPTGRWAQGPSSVEALCNLLERLAGVESTPHEEKQHVYAQGVSDYV